MSYEQIVFLQGSEANEPLAILDEHGPEAAVEHLAQYDEGKHPVSEDLSGAADQRFDSKERPGYLLSYNLELNYIGLAKKI